MYVDPEDSHSAYDAEHRSALSLRQPHHFAGLSSRRLVSDATEPQMSGDCGGIGKDGGFYKEVLDALANFIRFEKAPAEDMGEGKADFSAHFDEDSAKDEDVSSPPPLA